MKYKNKSSLETVADAAKTMETGGGHTEVVQSMQITSLDFLDSASNDTKALVFEPGFTLERSSVVGAVRKGGVSRGGGNTQELL